MKRKFLDELNPEKQELVSSVIDLRCKGFSYAQIADSLDITERFVYTACFLLGEEAYRKFKFFLYLRLTMPITYKHLTMSQLANETELSLKALFCVLCDLKLLRRPSVDFVRRLLNNKKDFVYLCDYYGLSHATMRAWLRKNGFMQAPIPRDTVKNLNFDDWRKTVFPFEELLTLSGEDLNPQYTISFDRISSNSLLLEAFHSERKALNRKILSLIRDKNSLSDEVDIFNSWYGFFSHWQYGIADPDNFFFNTMAIFTECSKPRRPADYTIADTENKKPKAQYWFTKKHVVRGSYVWGRDIHYPGNCDWFFQNSKGEFPPINYDSEHAGYSDRVYGLAKWEDFVYKTDVSNLDNGKAFLESFCNTRFGEVHQFNNINIRGDTIDNKDGFDRMYHFNF